MKEQHVVIDGTTARQMGELFRQIEKGLINRGQLQALLEGRNPFPLKREPFKTFIDQDSNLARVKRILGEDKVLTPRQSLRIHGQVVTDIHPLPNSLDWGLFEQCARENMEGKARWYFCFVQGFSMLELGQRFGVNQKRKPFFRQPMWWTQYPGNEWASQRYHGDYYLIDFMGRWSKLNWEHQEEQIAELGAKFSRTPEAVITEAAMGIYKTSLYSTPLLPTWCHWGPTKVIRGVEQRVCVGDFDGGGWYVWSESPNLVGDANWMVCVSRMYC